MKTEACGFPDCQRGAEATLGDRHLCLEHFTFSCFQQLDECERCFDAPLTLSENPDTLQQLLADLAQQATDLSKRRHDLNNLERARLTYIQVVAGELGRRLRRSPRRITVVPLRIRCEEPGLLWEQETQTKNISPRGALIHCTEPVKVGDKLWIWRLDTGRQATAQVVWQRSTSGRDREVGIEFVDCENFWGLDWNVGSTA